jgi:hypothetical protein
MQGLLRPLSTDFGQMRSWRAWLQHAPMASMRRPTRAGLGRDALGESLVHKRSPGTGEDRGFQVPFTGELSDGEETHHKNCPLLPMYVPSNVACSLCAIFFMEPETEV